MRLFNSTLRIKLIVTLLLFLISTPFLAIASDGGNLVKKDLIGFKYIHFGMTEEELENLGINCVVEICHLTESAEQLTILGQRTV